MAIFSRFHLLLEEHDKGGINLKEFPFLILHDIFIGHGTCISIDGNRIVKEAFWSSAGIKIHQKK